VKPAAPDAAPEAAAEAPCDRPGKMMYRKRSTARRPSPEQMQRQNDILQSAWRHFGAAAPVIAFLNTRHDQLEAQPLHLAVESAEGFDRVERLLEHLARKP